MDAYLYVRVLGLSNLDLKGLRSSSIQQEAKIGVKRMGLIHVYLGKNAVSTQLLLSCSLSNKVRVALCFYELQAVPALFFTLWLKRNGFFIVIFARLE